MEKYASELDFACVRLMEKRIEAAHRSGILIDPPAQSVFGPAKLLQCAMLAATRAAMDPHSHWKTLHLVQVADTQP